VVDALGEWEIPQRDRHPRVDRDRRWQEIPPPQVDHGLPGTVIEIISVARQPLSADVLDRGKIERDGVAPPWAESLVPRVDEDRDVASGAADRVRDPWWEDRPRRTPGGA
jgi:hypothetical protein